MIGSNAGRVLAATMLLVVARQRAQELLRDADGGCGRGQGTQEVPLCVGIPAAMGEGMGRGQALHDVQRCAACAALLRERAFHSSRVPMGAIGQASSTSRFLLHQACHPEDACKWREHQERPPFRMVDHPALKPPCTDVTAISGLRAGWCSNAVAPPAALSSTLALQSRPCYASASTRG